MALPSSIPDLLKGIESLVLADTADCLGSNLVPESNDTDSSKSPTLTEEDVEATKKEILLDVRRKLALNRLNVRGSDMVLQSRLFLFEKHELKSVSRPDNYQPLDYLIVVDFEATCEQGRPAGSYEQEIIEFPAVLVDTRTKQIVNEFHSYVRPRRNKISDFCTALTGITQDMVDSAEPFPQVLKLFHAWLIDQGLQKNTKWCIVTDGTFDVALFLHCTCKIYGMRLPSYFKLFVHLSKFFQWIYLSGDTTKRRANMVGMLEHLDLALEGRHHSGIDDARNMARICVEMLVDHVEFRPTDLADLGHTSALRPFCTEVMPVGRTKWRAAQKKCMQNLSSLLS